MPAEEKRGRCDPAHGESKNDPTRDKLRESRSDGKLDLSSRSQSMGREEAILWPSGASYKGVVRLRGGDYYWVQLRPATANGREVWWLTLARKEGAK